MEGKNLQDILDNLGQETSRRNREIIKTLEMIKTLAKEVYQKNKLVKGMSMAMFNLLQSSRDAGIILKDLRDNTLEIVGESNDNLKKEIFDLLDDTI